jgi:hypothetical protein
MKTFLLAALSLVLMQPVRAMEPGRYLVSTMEKSEKDKSLHRSFILTIGKDGKVAVELANPSRTTTKIESINVIEDESKEAFILQVKFIETEVTDNPPKTWKRSRLLALALDYSSGEGSELETNGASFNLEARMDKLPDPEPAK